MLAKVPGGMLVNEFEARFKRKTKKESENNKKQHESLFKVLRLESPVNISGFSEEIPLPFKVIKMKKKEK